MASRKIIGTIILGIAVIGIILAVYFFDLRYAIKRDLPTTTSADQLLSYTSPYKNLPDNSKASSLRKTVQVNYDTLLSKDNFYFTAPDGKIYKLARKMIERHDNNLISWTGSIEGVQGLTVTITVNQQADIASGLIDAYDNVYSIMPSPQGNIISKIDRTKFNESPDDTPLPSGVRY